MYPTLLSISSYKAWLYLKPHPLLDPSLLLSCFLHYFIDSSQRATKIRISVSASSEPNQRQYATILKRDLYHNIYELSHQ